MALRNEANVLEDFVGVSEGNIQRMRDEIAENPYKKALIKEALIRLMRKVAADLTEIVDKHIWDTFVLAIVPSIVIIFIVHYNHAPTPGNNMILIELISRIFQIGLGGIFIWCFLSVIEQNLKISKEQREALVKRFSHLNDIYEGLYDGMVEDLISEGELRTYRRRAFETSELADIERFVGILYVVSFLFTLCMLILSIFEFYHILS